ncbi:hypothetical protein D3C72_1533760 [compost metagenome]
MAVLQHVIQQNRQCGNDDNNVGDHGDQVAHRIRHPGDGILQILVQSCSQIRLAAQISADYRIIAQLIELELNILNDIRRIVDEVLDLFLKRWPYGHPENGEQREKNKVNEQNRERTLQLPPLQVINEGPKQIIEETGEHEGHEQQVNNSADRREEHRDLFPQIQNKQDKNNAERRAKKFVLQQ